MKGKVGPAGTRYSQGNFLGYAQKVWGFGSFFTTVKSICTNAAKIDSGPARGVRSRGVAWRGVGRQRGKRKVTGWLLITFD